MSMVRHSSGDDHLGAVVLKDAADVAVKSRFDVRSDEVGAVFGREDYVDKDLDQ